MSTKINHKTGYLIVFFSALLLYAITCAPTVLWQDSGMLQYRTWHKDITGGLGLALAHSVYFFITIAFSKIPIGDFAHRVNLVSALFGALTVANIFLLIKIITKNKTAAIIAALTAALSHTLWQHSNIAEVYSVYTAFLTLELILLYSFTKTKNTKYICLLALVNGLAVSLHMFAVIPLACYLCLAAFYIFNKQLKIKQLLAPSLLWLLGFLPYLYLILLHLAQTGDLAATISSALFGSGFDDSVLNALLTPRMVLENFLFIGLNFPTPNILLLLVGLVVIFKSPNKPFTITLTAVWLLFLIFAFRYTVPDRYAFFLPFYILTAIIIGLGAANFLTNHKKLKPYLVVACLLPVLIYFIAPPMAQKYNVPLGTKRTLPYRNDYKYFLCPWQLGYDGPAKFARQALQSVQQNAIILADGTTVYALWYIQINENFRPDVKIVSSHGEYHSPIPFPDKYEFDALLDKYNIYVVSAVEGYCPDYILQNYQLRDAGLITEILNKNRSQPK